MIGTTPPSSSSSSSCASFSSSDDTVSVGPNAVKLLCSYGGRILPRYPDGRLRYVGGETRVLSVDRSIPFSELQVKLRELCGWSTVGLRCQLPTEDLDALVSITSGEDLANLVEEYDLAGRDKMAAPKIRAFLHPASSASKSRESSRKFTGRMNAPIGSDPLKFSARPGNCFRHPVHNTNRWR